MPTGAGGFLVGGENATNAGGRRILERVDSDCVHTIVGVMTKLVELGSKAQTAKTETGRQLCVS